MKTEVYKRAPIVEAALDIRVRLNQPVNVESLEGVRDEKYPDLFLRPTRVEFKVQGNAASASAEASSQPLGFGYRSADRLNVFQVRTDGFTHNRLAPYQSWSPFEAEARRLWTLYSSATQPAEIELISLNYLNEFLMPVGESFEKHFRTYIEVPLELPQTINSFSMNYQLLMPDSTTVQIAQTYGPIKKPGYATINLNINAFKPLKLAAAAVNEENLWQMLRALRDAKDLAFEACITDTVREMIR